jgi:hypothetical protein
LNGVLKPRVCAGALSHILSCESIPIPGLTAGVSYCTTSVTVASVTVEEPEVPVTVTV